MKWEEKIAKKYLESLGYEKIEFEPTGNFPPDFLVNSSIAIEVRRLNKHFKSKYHEYSKPLEDLVYNLIPKIKSLLKKYSNIHFNNSVYVFVKFSRPLNPSKFLLNKIKGILDDNLVHIENIFEKKSIMVNNNLTIEIWPTNKKFESAYLLGGVIDRDWGGWVVGDVYQNLMLIINEKEKKVAPYFYNYKNWWLILVDLIGYGLDDEDMNQLNQLEFKTHNFDKIILLNPLNPIQGREIKI